MILIQSTTIKKDIHDSQSTVSSEIIAFENDAAAEKFWFHFLSAFAHLDPDSKQVVISANEIIIDNSGSYYSTNKKFYKRIEVEPMTMQHVENYIDNTKASYEFRQSQKK